MRSLIEQVVGNYAAVRMGVVQNGPSENTNDNVVKLFGTAKNDNNVPSKIIVRDCQLLSKYDHISELAQYTEIKTEVVIDRITAAAMPRTLERVPAGVEFDMEIVLNIWEGANELSENEAMRLIFMAMLLLESDYLGGKGSRGSGQVKIGIATITERDATFYNDIANIQQSSFTISAYQANIPNSLRIWTH
jgi:CRISPR-associated protein Csm3